MLLPRAVEILCYFSLIGLIFILVLDIVAAILHFSAVYIGLIPIILIVLHYLLGLYRVKFDIKGL